MVMIKGLLIARSRERGAASSYLSFSQRPLRHYLGRCISATPTRLFGRLRLYQQRRYNCQQPSRASGRHTVAAGRHTVATGRRTLGAARVSPQRDIPTVAWKGDTSRRRGIEGYAKEGHETGEIRVQAPQVAL